MVWLTSDDDQRKAILEIEQSKSDRACGIVGGAFLERDLRNAIEARLRKNDNAINKLFKPSGPLGPFETKADLAYLLNIFDEDVLADIKCIISIRNLFAHQRRPLDFGSTDIRKLCDAIKIVDRPEYPKVPGDNLPDWVRTAARLPEKATPRDRFILALRLLAIVLWAASERHVIGDNLRGFWSEKT